MATWCDEFTRLADLHRAAVDDWIAGANNVNTVIDTADAEKFFLIRWMSAGQPARTQEIRNHS